MKRLIIEKIYIESIIKKVFWGDGDPIHERRHKSIEKHVESVIVHKIIFLHFIHEVQLCLKLLFVLNETLKSFRNYTISPSRKRFSVDIILPKRFVVTW